MYHALKPFLLFPKTHRNKRIEVEKGVYLTTPSKGEKTGSVHNCMRVQQFLEAGMHVRICWVMNVPQRGRERVRYNLPVRNHEMLDSELKVKHVAEQKIKWRFTYRATVHTSFSHTPALGIPMSKKNMQNWGLLCGMNLLGLAKAFMEFSAPAYKPSYWAFCKHMSDSQLPISSCGSEIWQQTWPHHTTQGRGLTGKPTYKHSCGTNSYKWLSSVFNNNG